MAVPTRRGFMTAAAAAALAAATPARGQGPSLATLAARSGRFFGAALSASAFSPAKAAYRHLLEEECSVWVPEWQLKWAALVHDPQDAPDFTAADKIAAAAREGGKRLRGHTLIWHEQLPPWVEALETRADWDRFVAPHIEAASGHYRDTIFQWDVVNEPMKPEDGGADGMRRTPFYRMLGADYVAEAFRLAHEAAPEARLYLNEYDLCYAESWQERRRTDLLNLLERLLGQGVPVHGLGIQGHLNTGHTFREKTFANFLRTVEAMGLEIAVTELDVREADNAGKAGLAERRERAAAEVRKVISVALDNPALTGLVTWGLADSESWLRKSRPIPDNQGLPYDDRLRPAPMRATLAALFAAAPERKKA